MIVRKKTSKKKVVKTTELLLNSAMLEVSMKQLTLKEYNHYLKNGIDDEIDDLDTEFHDYIEFGSLIFDDIYSPILTAGDTIIRSDELYQLYAKELAASDISKMKPTIKKNGKSMFLVRRNFYKHAQYSLTVKGDFNLSKFKFNPSGDTSTFTEVMIGFDPTYGGKDFEFDFADGASFSTWYLLRSNGTTTMV